MLREDCHIGMEVSFGRRRGEKTRGIIVKLNLKRAKVQTTESRGNRSDSGAVWSVDYGILKTVNGNGESLHQKHGANAPGALTEIMTNAAEKTAIPNRFTTDHQGSHVVILDTQTDKTSTIALCDYSGARKLLNDLFGE